jgi:predicted DNA-binding transcriptional regulator YafY
VYHPTTRLLTVLELLQTHGTMRRADLAARLEVGERSVRRYIANLQEMGIPVVGERGRYGGYRLRPGFRLPPLMFGEDEATAVVLGLLAMRRLGLTAAAPATEGALAKIERVLPSALREQLQAMQEVLVLNLRPAEMPAVSGVIRTLTAAAQQRRRVRLRYRSSVREETERNFDPFAVVYHAGRWYTAGHCHLRRGRRVFRLDRVVEVTPDQDAVPFTRPSDFDGLEAVIRSLAVTPRAYPVVVTLFTSPEEARQAVPASLGTASLSEEAEGVVLRCTTDSPEWMARVLAGLDCDVVVHEPPELRDALRRLAARLVRAAAGPGAPGGTVPGSATDAEA